MKTPEEIKADAATCLTKPPHAMCDRFDLNKKCKGDCRYIIKELYDLVLQLESSLAQVELERDAAIVDMRSMAVEDICNLCARIDEGYIPMPPHCKYADDGDCFRWRGVCEENTKED